MVTLQLSLNEKNQLSIVGIPKDAEGRKVCIQILAEAIKSVSALKPVEHDLLLPNREIITSPNGG